ncbi:hypothetical protein SAMN05428988_4687 [Chitinophaga sp. YR573]|uniref:hypothetical protein n=1 Tax=Chitinophaga sp. YR573 TaxID=1881040 RepID=UPI0008C0645A|nr:hypothetical protein [Chitinophaga sp. YR573]SEW37569.1 hypothetical protein SAMN05428988_4687 [Chitinophaga sp. YR573]
MKKIFSITFLAAVLAAGTAFAGRSEESSTEWMLNDFSVVVGLQSDIKTIYCAGANNVQCAFMVEAPYTLIRKP